MVTKKMLTNKSHKYLNNVNFLISAIRRIEPNNLPLASLTLEWTSNIVTFSLNPLFSRAMLSSGVALSK